MKEIWKPVVEWEGLYEVSNLGRVRSLQRETTHKNGTVQPIPQKMMKLSVATNGYIRISFNKPGAVKNVMVHILVINAFVGPCPKGQEVGHLDGNRKNNNLENLRYMSKQCNAAFCIEHGTDPVGSRNPNSKLTDTDVRFIKTLIRDGFRPRHIAKIYGVTASNIGHIKSGRQWGHIN